jgi:hypothetical protein
VRTSRVLGSVSLAAAAAACLVTIAQVEAQPGSTCGLTNPAFCDTFNQPSAVRGRAGDLNPASWTAGRLAPQDFSGFGPVANPVATAPVPACRASLPISTAFPPNDTLICDATATRSAQLMTAIVAQNYGLNSYMIKRPFDFAGRTGKIVFDVDAVVVDWLAGFLSIDITEDPLTAPTFREFGNYEHGAFPRNALMIKFSDNCLTPGNAITAGKVMVYTNYQGVVIQPTFLAQWGTTPSCLSTRSQFLNHFEIRLSQNQLEIYGSDYSPDDGQTYPNLRRIYAANINLPFTRGYVHLAARNHASKKYGHGPDHIYHWDNVGFDGPAIVGPRIYEIPDNTTMSSYQGGQFMNLGYQLLDGTTGKPAGIYNPTTSVGPLTFQGVDVAGATGASLAMNGHFNAMTHTASPSWGIRYRLNGGAWRDRTLTATEVQVISAVDADGNIGLVIDVPTSDLRNGNNTLDLLPIGNAPMDLPPTIANINLVVRTNGAVTPPPGPPTNLRIIRAMLLFPQSFMGRPDAVAGTRTYPLAH